MEKEYIEWVMKLQCPRCLNEDKRLFAQGKRGVYCRACIGFKRQLIEEEKSPKESFVKDLDSKLELSFTLSKQQKEISLKLKEIIKEKDCLINAVCGAGKTEMLLDMLQDCFGSKKSVAIAIARRQVVLELVERLNSYFPNVNIIPVCQGYTSKTEGDMIVCTTHQLYRYYQAFDVLVIDEPDAFPYKGNAVLKGIAKTSCRGHRVFLTATPDDDLMNEVKSGKMAMLSLNQRPHGFPLPEPDVFVNLPMLCFLHLLSWLNKKKNYRQVMLFVPTIKMANHMFYFLRLWLNCCVCTSKTKNRDDTIERFRRKEIQCCICTSVLERGVTFIGVDVVVYQADHPVFDEAALVQIAGRAGRKKEDPYGEVKFYAFSKKREVDQCIERIKTANQTLSFVQSAYE